MDDKKAVITVIIPTFNRFRMLKQAIDSVFAQTYPYFKICIYDNASQDETEQIMKQYHDDRIKYHRHSQNIGLNKNYDFALNQVDTPFFVFLSDDDLFMPVFLEEAMKCFENYPDAGLFIGSMIYMDKNKQLVGAAQSKLGHFSSKEVIGEIVRGHFTALINSIIFRKEVKDKIGPFNDRIWLDVDFVVRAIFEFSVIFSPVSCIIYQLHSNGSHRASIEEYWDMKIAIRDRILQSHLALSIEKKDIDALLHSEIRKFLYEMVYERFVSKRFDESLKGIKILQTHYGLNKREKIIKFLSKILLKNRVFVYSFAVIVYLKRLVMRFFHIRKLKEKIGDDNYRAFIDFLAKI